MAGISENSRRIAKNTILLYVRMLLLMVIGLYTSRVVLDSLGISDFGVYGAVGGLVMLFTVVTNSVSQSISRYITWHLGKGGEGRLHSVFSTAVVMQLIFCVILLILTETLGLWWLGNHMNIPAERMGAARWVLQCSMGVLMVNLLSVPFNATIVSHERMDVFAWISLAEAALKLAVALLLAFSPADKLKTYAVLMLAVAVAVRLTYGIVCRRLFPETRGRAVFDRGLLKEMTSFAGWNVLGSGAYIVNTQGVNQVVNIFFGVTVNAARLAALQVENILKQFVTNFLTALNPQITKSYAAGDRSYSFNLVNKGIKFSGIILLVIGIPLVLEAPTLLQIWLKEVPEHTVLFTRLTVACLFADLMFNPLLTLIQADGRVKGYYIVSSAVALLAFAASWAAFAMGAPAYVSYVFFALVYFAADAVKVVFAHRLSAYPVGAMLRQAALPVLLVGLLSSTIPLFLHVLIDNGILRLLAVVAATALILPLLCWRCALTEGEKDFVMRKMGKHIPDAVYLRYLYRKIFGRRLNLRRPRLLSEKVQWLKLHDRRPEYTALSDKAAVKDIVAERLGAGFVIPTLGVWDRVADIDWDALPERFVLKCTHDSGSVVVCRSRASFDRDAAIRSLSEALKRNFYLSAREWAYKDIKPQIIAEPYLDDGHPEGLTDYKFFCFSGEPRFAYVSRGLEDHATARMSFVLPDWTPAPMRRSDFTPFDELPPRPDGLDTMLDASRKLSAGIPYVRVDFYQVGAKVLFSEMTFYPCGGFMPLENEEQDLAAGEMLELPHRK